MTDYISKIRYLTLVFSGKVNSGYCPVCEKNTLFIRLNPWLRDHYKCMNCYSIPRQRALINALNLFYPNWPDAVVHESSPGGVSSDHFRRKCKKYSYSYFFQDVKPGSTKNGARCENLEEMTFDNEQFDLIITQDVFEHINYPERAFREIARVLKPGGMHIFTVPLYLDRARTRTRFIIEDGIIHHLLDPVYHGNPIDKNGSLVTVDYGRDFADIIYTSSGMTTTIYLQKDLHLGLDAQFLEVCISKKSEPNSLQDAGMEVKKVPG